MKKFLFTIVLSHLAILGFCQDVEENGTIYIRHPYIEVVNNLMNSEISASAQYYADTAMWWSSGMEKPIQIADALAMLTKIGEFYDEIKITPVGYPDYLHYTEGDSKWVQSWWLWSGKSKKTGEELKVDFVQFDRFNKDGKIELELNYGDFSKMEME